MHIISAADFLLFCSILLEDAVFCQQNAGLKNRLFQFIQAYHWLADQGLASA